MGKEEYHPSDSNVPTVSDSRILSSEVTVFIDESSIPNPWKWMDNDLSDLQGSYSYIICEGYLSSEKEISPMNTMTSKACPSRWSDNSTVSSLEAITTVLEVLSFQYEFHDRVNIYTDNESIVKRWRDNPFSLNLSASFKHISVEFIPRELNQQADSLLNQHVFSDLPKKTMTRIKKVVHENIKTCEELDYIHAFFNDPRKDIPALFEALERLANMAGYNPYNTAPDMTPSDRLRMLLSMIRIGLDHSQSSETPSHETAQYIRSPTSSVY